MTSRQARSSKPKAATDTRAAQRDRTRKAILAAARELLRTSASPSIDEIAAAAQVSRRTVYMHFPTLDQLLLDAASGLLAEAQVGAVLDPDRFGSDVRARVEALAQALIDLAPDALPLGRQIIRLTVDRPNDATGKKRGYRHVDWIEQAIEPLRAQLSKEQHERLVSALAVVIGWEAMIVLRDVRGLRPRREAEVIRWTARALIDAMLSEAAARPRA